MVHQKLLKCGPWQEFLQLQADVFLRRTSCVQEQSVCKQVRSAQVHCSPAERALLFLSHSFLRQMKYLLPEFRPVSANLHPETQDPPCSYAVSPFPKLHRQVRSEEHTSELQSPDHLVC